MESMANLWDEECMAGRRCSQKLIMPRRHISKNRRAVACYTAHVVSIGQRLLGSPWAISDGHPAGIP